MAAPQIQDRHGKPLSVGDQVERVFESGKTGGMVGKVFHLGERVWVEWGRRNSLGYFEARRRFTLRRSYRCDDLELIDDTEKEKAK